MYDTDIVAWAQEQARLLRERRFDLVDVDNVAEEIETLGRAERKALRSAVREMLSLMTKVAYSPDPRASWVVLLVGQRTEIKNILRDSPCLRAELGSLFGAEWSDAREIAIAELAVRGEQPDVPVRCPYAVDSALTDSENDAQ